jgi:hypothetical protein
MKIRIFWDVVSRRLLVADVSRDRSDFVFKVKKTSCAPWGVASWTVTKVYALKMNEVFRVFILEQDECLKPGDLPKTHAVLEIGELNTEILSHYEIPNFRRSAVHVRLLILHVSCFRGFKEQKRCFVDSKKNDANFNQDSRQTTSVYEP